MNNILARIKSTEVEVRNRAAIDFINSVDSIREGLLEAIKDPRNENYRGTLVYALQSISCHDFFIPLFKILFDSNFEVFMSIYHIFEKQNFAPNQSEKVEARSLFQSYLQNLAKSRYDFENERKLKIKDILEWYCGEITMEHQDLIISEKFLYCPIFVKENDRLFCYRVFQNLKTNKFHVQSKDCASTDISEINQLNKQFVELFSEVAPSFRVQGYLTAIEAINNFDQDFL